MSTGGPLPFGLWRRRCLARSRNKFIEILVAATTSEALNECTSRSSDRGMVVKQQKVSIIREMGDNPSACRKLLLAGKF
jgi:hypothetical protein